MTFKNSLPPFVCKHGHSREDQDTSFHHRIQESIARIKSALSEEGSVQDAEWKCHLGNLGQNLETEGDFSKETFERDGVELNEEEGPGHGIQKAQISQGFQKKYLDFFSEEGRELYGHLWRESHQNALEAENLEAGVRDSPEEKKETIENASSLASTSTPKMFFAAHEYGVGDCSKNAIGKNKAIAAFPPTLGSGFGSSLPDMRENCLYGVVKDMDPSEIAYIIRYLEEPYRSLFVKRLKTTFDPQVFLFLAPNILTEVISWLSDGEIAQVMRGLKSDDGVFLLSALPHERQEAAIDALGPDLGGPLIQRLGYPPDSAGRLMQQEVVTFEAHWSAAQCLEHVRTAPHLSDTVSEIFVLDQKKIVVGSVSLATLLKSPPYGPISPLLKTKVHPMSLSWSQEEVALAFRLYNLMCAPVVNEAGELMGMITADDIIDVIEREASEDLMYMGRVHGSDFYESVLKTSFSRINWLILTLLNTVLTALVINEFQETLQAKVALTILMPVAAAMGGNTGIQAATVVIRALATRELGHANMVRTFVKELRVALVNGAILATSLGVGTYVWLADIQFAWILACAVLFNMIWAGCAGTLFPILISAFRGDPALSAGSLITTTTDVIGYAAFLSLARYFMQ